jgi:hypothetical protein
MTVTLGTSSVWPIGYPAHRVARNGRPVSGGNIAQLVGLMNTITARRHQVYFSKHIAHASDFYTASAGPQVLWRTRFQVPEGVKEVRALVSYMPAVNTYLATGSPYYRFNVNGGTGDSLYTQYTDGYVDQLTDHRWHHVSFPDIAPGDDVELEFEVANGARAVFCTVFGVPRETVDTATFGVDPRQLGHGSPLTEGTGFGAMSAAATQAWNTQGSVHFNWCRPTGASYDRAAASYANVLDSSTGGWSSSALGWYFNPRGRFRQFTDANRSPCRCWVYASATNSDGLVKFTGSDGIVMGGGLTIATVNVTSATPDWYVVDGLCASAFPTDLAIVEAHGGTGTTSVYAAGMYDFTP